MRGRSVPRLRRRRLPLDLLCSAVTPPADERGAYHGAIRSRRLCERMSGRVTASASLPAWGSRTTASAGLNSTTSGPPVGSACGVAAARTTWCSCAPGRTASRRSRDAAGVPSCWPGSNGRSASSSDPQPRDSVKGHLGLLVGVRGAVPIPQLLDRRGEKGQEATGGLGVAWFGLLSIGTYLRARLDRLVSRCASS